MVLHFSLTIIRLVVLYGIISYGYCFLLNPTPVEYIKKLIFNFNLPSWICTKSLIYHLESKNTEEWCIVDKKKCSLNFIGGYHSDTFYLHLLGCCLY